MKGEIKTIAVPSSWTAPSWLFSLLIEKIDQGGIFADWFIPGF